MAGPRGPVRRRTAAVACLAVLLVVAASPAFLSAPAGAVSYTLWGSATQGWGLTQTTITSPGPTLIATQGERVDLTLFSADGVEHSWCVDYDSDGSCTPGVDNESAHFFPSTPASHAFIPTRAPGIYTYICGVHLGAVMNGLFRINPAVKPTVSIVSPTGTQRWTGGSTHSVVWNMNDPNDPLTSLRAWVNYTIAGGPPNPIAGPIAGSSNPHSTPWTVPLVDTPSAAVNVTVVDPAGNRAWAVRLVPAIDSTAPTIVNRSPGNGATGVPTTTSVAVTFSEAMNRTVTADPGVVALQDTRTPFPWVPVTYGWSAGDTVLTLTPLSVLDTSTMYRATVNASATDASDPGNPIGPASAWVFTTAAAGDTVKPQIANVLATPSPGEYGFSVDITATITDNDRVAQAYVNVTLPDNSGFNHSMSVFSGNTWIWSQVYPLLGDYSFRVEAADASGNWNRSAVSRFSVVDTTAPALSGLAVAPSPAEVYMPATISVTATDPFLSNVQVELEGVNLTMSFNPATTKWERTFTPSRAQTYAFTIWADDTSGNLASLAGSVVAQDTMPPPVPQDLSAVLRGANAVDLRWTNVVGAVDLAGYRLYRSTSSGGPFTQVGPSPITANAFTDTTVAAGVTYYYVVTSVDLGGRESARSNVASITLPVAPVDYTLAIVAGLAVLILIVAIAAVLIIRRRRQKGA